MTTQNFTTITIDDTQNKTDGFILCIHDGMTCFFFFSVVYINVYVNNFLKGCTQI